MDCEKFDQIIIDAVYDELDELTLAAAKRHADSCQHCQAAWSGLRATRKIGILPLVEAPAGMEARIMKAAREAHRNLPWPKRVGRAISWAGNYAMRPQMAMAALLVLMLGASVTILRARPDRSAASSRISVTERGVPEQAAEEPRTDKSLADDRVPALPPAGRLAKRDDDRAAASAAPPPAFAAAPPPVELERKGGFDKSEAFLEPKPKSAAPAAAPADEIALNGAPQRSAGAGAEKKGVQLGLGAPGAVGGQAAATAGPQDAFATAMNLYNSGRYAEAERAFNDIEASRSKDSPRAALMAAKSSYGAFGCGKAAPQYENVWARYSSTSPGAEALWLSADCYMQLGNYPKARDQYTQLQTVAGYGDRAMDKLRDLNILQQQQVAARQRAVAPPAAAAKPSAPKAAPKSNTNQSF
jgi:TolA-binding protein